ncbi:MAG: hypothetical protein AABZ06_02390 [Bdellovibrionota bacterium]
MSNTSDQKFSKQVVKALRELHDASPSASAIFRVFAAGKYAPKQSTVDVLMKNLVHDKTSRGDIVKLFQELHKLELGVFVLGRREKASRIEWYAAVYEVGRAAIGEIDEIKKYPPEDLDEDVDEKMLSLTIPVRPDLTVTIELPVTLTEDDAERICDFIKRVPFNRKK